MDLLARLPSDLDPIVTRVAVVFTIIAALGLGFLRGATYRAGLAVRDHGDAHYYRAEANRLRWARDRCMGVATYSTAHAELVQAWATTWLGEVERPEVELVEVDDR